jgi:hypothetical protein
MQTIRFAFVEVLGYDYNIKQALLDRAAVTFDLTVASTGPVVPVAAMPNRSGLVDGSLWQQPSKYRKKQAFSTFPDLLLGGAKIDGTFYTYSELLTRWFAARARWINTGIVPEFSRGPSRGLYDPTLGTEGFVKVIPVEEALTLMAFENKGWAQILDAEVETMEVY